MYSFIRFIKNIFEVRRIKNASAVVFTALFVGAFAATVKADTIVVNSIADTDGNCDNAHCTLRQAINNSNASPASENTIVFNIPGGGVHTIKPGLELPAIVVSVTIDGTTQPGFAGTPLIEIDGENAFRIGGLPADGLTVRNGTVIIKSLAVNRFSGSGIYAIIGSFLFARFDLTVQGCYIGTNAAGTLDLGNGGDGIVFSSGIGTHHIGGTGANQGNIISGNEGNGITIFNDIEASNYTIENNRIGTSASGAAAIGNTQNGISITVENSNLANPGAINIGGANAASRNIISGNGKNGILSAPLGGLANDGTVLNVLNNYIGVSAAGSVDLGNGANGVYLEGQYIAEIGSANAGNVISGNNQNGIYVKSGINAPTIYANKIGTNANGTVAVANSQRGIEAFAPVYIGDHTFDATGNVISGNLFDGIELANGSSGSEVYSNYIGISSNNTALPNSLNGIVVRSSNNKIGVANNNYGRNTISGNGESGVVITSQNAKNNFVQNNFIGTNANGASSIGNGASGVRLSGLAILNTIGGASVGAGNVISGNAGDGVLVTNAALSGDADRNFILQNSIFQNGGEGIDLGGDGSTPNDLNDADTGPNGLQNYPVITLASPGQIAGTLNSNANQNYRIEFFRNDSCDSSGHGEGKYYLGMVNTATDANGNASFTLSGLSLSANQTVTATATNTIVNSTSEFSLCRTGGYAGVFSFSSANYSVNETAGAATITVNRAFGSAGAVSVDYAVSNGTAMVGQDYVLTFGTLQFADGQTSKTFTVPIVDDQIYEGDETVNLALTNATGGANFLPPTSAILTIVDNEQPPATQRKLRAVGSAAVPGQTAQASVEFDAQGDENSVGFSINYDAAILSSPNVSLGANAANASLIVNNSQNGKLGIKIALPAGQTFAAGATKQIAAITFQTAQTNQFNTPLTFADAPVTRQIANANVDALPANYQNGLITFAQGFEADVAPRPNGSGNGTITVADFTEVGKFVAGIDTPDAPAATNEFMRADCAPRNTSGNGQLTVSDYTQAGRYAAGLDAVQTADGAAQANFAKSSTSESVLSAENDLLKTVSASRNVRVVSATASPNSQVLVSIEADTVGDENAFGFSINYDAAKLSNPLVSLGTATQGATLIPNLLQSGKIGVVLAFPTSQTIQAGTKQLVTIRFDVAANAAGGNTALTFADSPVVRETVNQNADVLPTNYQGGAISILGPTSASVSIGGRVTTNKGRGIADEAVTLTDANGQMRTVLTNQSGFYRFDDAAAGQIYVLKVSSKYYNFSEGVRVVNLTESVGNIDFVSADD